MNRYENIKDERTSFKTTEDSTQFKHMARNSPNSRSEALRVGVHNGARSAPEFGTSPGVLR